MKKRLSSLISLEKSSLLVVILILFAIVALQADSHIDHNTGKEINNFLNVHNLTQMATDTSPFAIMAIGATIVIVSGGIDLSVGSIYALSGVFTAMLLRSLSNLDLGPGTTVAVAAITCVGLGLLCGLINGIMIVGLSVHPFIITLGTMWIFRGLASVASGANSILFPDALTRAIKSSMTANQSLNQIPLLVMLGVTALGALYLTRTVMGRHIYAVGGNPEASRYAGLRNGRILIGVYALSGLTAGIAALVGSGYYGSASCADATGYELYVIASAVVGGASLRGGKGSAVNAMLGAVLIVLFRQSIRTLNWDQNFEWIIVGGAIIVAVKLDQLSSRFAARRLMANQQKEKEDQS